MGNAGSAGSGNARRRSNSGDQLHSPPPPSLPSPQPAVAQPPEVSGNRYVFAAATPYPPQYANGVGNPPQYYQFSGYYQHPPPAAMPVPLPAPFDHHHHRLSSSHGYPYGHVPPPPPIIQPPIVEHQKAVTIRNDVNLKKETLRMVPDEDNPGRFLVAFTFDATVDGSITILYFAKEGFECNLTPMKENLLQPVTISFKEGLSQKFQQPSGTGINFSMFTESELTKEGEMEVYPLAVKAEASLDDKQESTKGERGKTRAPNSQITQAVFEKKENGEYRVRVVKQILWVSGTRYELQEIYGIGNSVEGDFDGNDPGKECVICLTNQRDTTVLPCRHMCMCTECAQVLRYQSNRCPICRQPVERLLEIRVHNNSSKGSEEQMWGGERAAAASTGGSSNMPNDETKSP